MRYLVAVADELSFTRAAEKCHVSQPPLSRAIRELEKEIGVRIFERNKHSVTVTLAGASLVSDARQALALLEEGIQRARRTAQGLSGSLSLGFGGSTVYALWPTLVHRFRRGVTDVTLKFRPMSLLRQIEALRSGEIDIGIVRLPIFDEMIEAQFVYSEPLVVALPLGHSALSQPGAVSITALRTSRFITYERARGFNFQADLHALCRLANFQPIIVHEAPTTEAVIGIVACREGVAIVPASAKRLRMHGVVFRNLDIAKIPARLAKVQFALAWRKNTANAAALEFIERATSGATPDN